MTTIDLNADLGEGMDTDEAMLDLVSSASIACGGHAGDAGTMRLAVRQAMARGVAIGAHPGYADRPNFGRVRLDLPPHELASSVGRQVRDLMAIADEEGATVRFVKLHGALANLAAEDRGVGAAAFGAVAAISGDLVVLALEASEQVPAADAAGLRVVAEAYADRAYRGDGLLAPRGEAGALIDDIVAVARQAVRIAAAHRIGARDDIELVTAARSICLHGDTPRAVELAKAVRTALHEAGVTVAAFA